MLGLGRTRVPSLGMIINQATAASALLRGMTWWWFPPILILMIIFTSFFLITVGLDEIANPVFEGGQGMNDGIVLAPKVLEVDNLSVSYFTPRGAVIAANKVNFYIRKGEIVGLVGESGCGKTTVAMSILQMVQSPGKIVGGEVRINGRNIIGMDEQQLRKIRWRELALVPQGAMNSLNPVLRIKEQMGDSIQAHEKIGGQALQDRVLKLLDDVGLPGRVDNMYPHELSGGMKQRVLHRHGDRPQPAGDHRRRADQRARCGGATGGRGNAAGRQAAAGVSMLMIGHDMGLQAQMVNRLAVMYAGNLVEIGGVESIFERPLHPYTQLLMESIPSIEERKPLKVTEGLTHDLRNPPPGCIFQYRCPLAREACRAERPTLVEVELDHFVSCINYQTAKVA